MFHELFAFGPPWGSAFWTSPVQRWLTKSLARFSGHCFTNMSSRADILKKYTSRNDSDFTILPVFSNLGEPADLPAWNTRRPSLVVFGSDGSRRKTYLEHKSSLEAACRAMDLKEIIDIGRTIEIPSLAVPVVRRGVLSVAAGSREMLQARAGFFNHDADCLGKSGVYAAYAVHGLAPVTFDENRIVNQDGLLPDVHFLFAPTARAEKAEKIGLQARQWYAGHSQPRQAVQFSEIIKRSTVGQAEAPGTVPRDFAKNHATA
jgi:hypothetical protein